MSARIKTGCTNCGKEFHGSLSCEKCVICNEVLCIDCTCDEVKVCSSCHHGLDNLEALSDYRKEE